MKRNCTILVAVLLSAIVFAQAPEKMSYQAVIRNNSNQLVSNKVVGMKISLVRGSALGLIVYTETHMATTNSNGLINIEIGGGTVLSGNFVSNDWSNGPYFIQTDIDPEGGEKYTISGTTQLLSVPYALYAETSGNSHYIGEHYGGGIVFFVYDKGQHGLIAAPSDQSVAETWNDGLGDIFIGSQADGLGAGKSNTALIIASREQYSIADYAARVCYEYKITENGVTYGDWYLPSRYELHLLQLQKDIVGDFKASICWSSNASEVSTEIAYAQDFRSDNFESRFKTTVAGVRAIRSF